MNIVDKNSLLRGIIVSMERTSLIRVGSRVYLRNAIAGEPGVVHEISIGYAKVEWVDMPELGRLTSHNLDSLVIDEAFRVKQLALEFDAVAA